MFVHSNEHLFPGLTDLALVAVYILYFVHDVYFFIHCISLPVLIRRTTGDVP